MKIVPILIFVSAFILVTGGLIFLNTTYANIFKFDFSPESERVLIQDSTNNMKKELAKQEELHPDKIIDSLTVSDTLNSLTADIKDSVSLISKQDSIINTTSKPNLTVQKPDTSNKEIQNPELTKAVKKGDIDSTYINWIKDTAKMYEAMEPKKAARIIENYPDDVARDIMYKMKKKKAAEILAEFDPIVANRITRYW